MRFTRTLVACGLALSVAGCRSPSATLHQTPPQPAPRSTGLVRQEPPAHRRKDTAEIWLNVSASEEDKVYRGWPLMLNVEVGYPEGMLAAQGGRLSKSLSIIPPSGKWNTLVSVYFHDSAQRRLNLPWVQAFMKPEGALVLGESGGVLDWYLRPEETRKLALGRYEGFAILESVAGADQGGWTGRAGSSTVIFDVVDEPVPLSDELAEEKAVQFAQSLTDAAESG